MGITGATSFFFVLFFEIMVPGHLGLSSLGFEIIFFPEGNFSTPKPSEVIWRREA